MNLKPNQIEGSAVYEAIRRLRNTFDRHSYVGYTATPQGPLVIQIADSLSPKFVTLLKSGDDYIGGEELFANPDSKFVMEIPESERTQIAPSTIDATPPMTLKNALAYFLLALVEAQRRQNPRPLSMLIHPSVYKYDHRLYFGWVENILSRWRLHLQDDGEEIFTEEMNSNFIQAERELKKSVKLPEDWDLRNAQIGRAHV